MPFAKRLFHDTQDPFPRLHEVWSLRGLDPWVRHRVNQGRLTKHSLNFSFTGFSLENSHGTQNHGGLEHDFPFQRGDFFRFYIC